MVKVNAERANPVDYESLGAVTSFVVLPSFLTSLVENFSYSVHNIWIWKLPIGPRALIWEPYVFSIGLLTPLAVVAYRGGRTATLSFLAGLTIAITMVHFFRGAIYWPGVFDREGGSKLHLIGPLVVPAILGFGLLPFFREASTRAPLRIAFVAGALALMYTQIHRYAEAGLSSYFAYTRPVGDVCLLVLLIAASTWEHFFGD